MSGQYAELVKRAIKWADGIDDDVIHGIVGWNKESLVKQKQDWMEAASALTTLTQQLQQMGDKAVPVVNGGASTTASGTQEHRPAATREQHLGSNAVNQCDAKEGSIPSGPALGQLEREVSQLRLALNPRTWTQDMSNAWHRAIPDLQKAFDDLSAEALKNAPQMKVDRTAPETSTRSADE